MNRGRGLRSSPTQVGELARDWAVYWRYGLSLWDGWSQSQLLLRQETGGSEALGTGCILVQAQGERPEAVLREVRRAVSWIRVGGEPQETLLVDGQEVPVETLYPERLESDASTATDGLRIAGQSADRLSEDEQETLLEILGKRLAERRRAEIAEDLRQARLDYERSEAREVRPDELMDEILG